MDTATILDRLGLTGALHGAFGGEWMEASGDELASVNPATGETIATLRMGGAAEYEAVAASAVETFDEWRMLPAPKRGDYVRQIGNALRDVKRELGALVTLESGKILAEGEGENSGTRSGRAGSSRLSTSRSRCGRGTHSSPQSAAIRTSGSRRCGHR